MALSYSGIHGLQTIRVFIQQELWDCGWECIVVLPVTLAKQKGAKYIWKNLVP
jgi:hypothetical protein